MHVHYSPSCTTASLILPVFLAIEMGEEVGAKGLTGYLLCCPFNAWLRPVNAPKIFRYTFNSVNCFILMYPQNICGLVAFIIFIYFIAFIILMALCFLKNPSGNAEEQDENVRFKSK